MEIRNWAPDLIERDDESLIQQIRTRVLPRRGVPAMPDEIVVERLPAGAVPDRGPCAASTRRSASRTPAIRTRATSSRTATLPAHGIAPARSARRSRCDYVYVTPSHQCPTTATMPVERRRALSIARSSMTS